MVVEFITEGGDCSVQYEDSPEIHKTIFDKVIEFCKKNEYFHGDEILHVIASDERQFFTLLSEIVGGIIKFNVDYVYIKEPGLCEYKLSEKEINYPRTRWDCSCGFDFVLMEGYKFDVDGGRTSELQKPTGKCMRCKDKIIAVYG